MISLKDYYVPAIKLEFSRASRLVQFMNIVVISLPSSTERRERVKLSMMQAGLDFRFIDAVNGSLDKHPLLEKYNHSKHVFYNGRPAVAGELGCYASHYLAWQQCVDSEAPLLVLEDDFDIVGDLTGAIDFCQHYIHELSFIRLESTSKRPMLTAFEDGKHSLKLLLKGAQCTTCYMLTPEAAKRFINASAEFIFPVDVMIRNHSTHGVPLHALFPAVIRQSKQGKSIIGPRKAGKRPLGVTMIRPFARLFIKSQNLWSSIKLIWSHILYRTNLDVQKAEI